MTDIFSPVERQTAPQIITQRLKKAIMSGDIPMGTKLPSERELAAQMNVSRPVIREAIMMLTSYGLITSRQGGGNYVVDNFAENVFEFMGFSDSLNAENYEYFFACRNLFECGMTDSVIANAGQEDIRNLESINEMFLQELESEQYVHAEIKFHSEYIRLSGNPLIVELYKLVLKFVHDSASWLLSAEMIRKEAFEAHREIIEALKAKDRENCLKAVRKHLDVAKNNLKNYFETAV